MDEIDPYQVDSESDSEVSEAQVEHVSEQVAAESVAERKRSKPFWAPKHIAYIKGLPYCVVPEEYERVFKDCGDVISVAEQLDDAGKWTGCLFVRYATEDALKNVIAVWNEAVWTGKHTLSRDAIDD